VQDVELAGPGTGEVLVRLLACGVCHTDLYTASGADPSGYAPSLRSLTSMSVKQSLKER
jgi:S-(hydroxymethyl)glutathione dehydrogenase/alcohol dehydrogenase